MRCPMIPSRVLKKPTGSSERSGLVEEAEHLVKPEVDPHLP